MEEEIISSTMTKSEDSESNSSNSPPQSLKPASRYKGVVIQPTGHWGAQIYANKKRIWLGTFNTEAEAAAAYDSAAMKLRHDSSAEPHRNFPHTDLTVLEKTFQEQFKDNNEEVINMIKDGSYPTKFAEFLASISQISGSSTLPPNSSQRNRGHLCKELFRKELTPSDVGKLNRLVIPKRHALQYFNPNNLVGQDFGVSRQGEGEDIELTFYDKSMRRWPFRYCYWQSSASFVFTRGWSSFLKVKDLKAKDTVVFYTCEYMENHNGNDVLRKFYMIDTMGINASQELVEGVPSRKRTLEEDGVTSDDEIQAKKARAEESTVSKEGKGFRLFGVQIVPDH